LSKPKTIEELAIAYILAEQERRKAKDAHVYAIQHEPCDAVKKQKERPGAEPFDTEYRCFESTRLLKDRQEEGKTYSIPPEYGVGYGLCDGCKRTLEAYRAKCKTSIARGHAHASVLVAVRRKLSG